MHLLVAMPFSQKKISSVKEVMATLEREFFFSNPQTGLMIETLLFHD